jgi:DNA-binding NarL/FixJ family response regulator
MFSLLLVEDHAVLSYTLMRLLSKQKNLAVIAAVPTGEAALEQLPHLQVDLAIIDVSLPTMSGIELVAILQKRFPTLPCLMLSGHKEPVYVRSALAAGARGYVIKGKAEMLLEAIPRVLAGDIYLSAELRTI